MIFKNEGPIIGTELKAADFVTAGDSIVPIEGAVLFELAQVWKITQKKYVIENKNYLLKKRCTTKHKYYILLRTVFH
jgi:hypothetical protein